MKIQQGVLILIAILSLNSCNVLNKSKNTNKETDSSEGITIGNHKWQIMELNKKPVANIVNDKTPYIQFSADNYNANAGCNTLNGGYTLQGEAGIKFATGISTMMACPEMQYEQLLAKAIMATQEYGIKGDILSFIDSKKDTVAKFKLLKENKQDTNWSGTWELDYISGPRIAFAGLYPNQKPTLNLDLATNKVSGNGSCNNYQTQVKLADHQISFGSIRSTEMACEGSGEQLYFSTLEKITSYSIQGNTLTLIMGDIAMMRFHKK